MNALNKDVRQVPEERRGGYKERYHPAPTGKAFYGFCATSIPGVHLIASQRSKAGKAASVSPLYSKRTEALRNDTASPESHSISLPCCLCPPQFVLNSNPKG